MIEAVETLRKRLGTGWPFAASRQPPDVTAIVLGSGLGGLADQIEAPIAIPFTDIPGFGQATAGGHRGQLIFGSLDDRPVIAMAGRLHRYEGWSNQQVAFPIQVMQRLGATRLIASNAAGGVNPKLRVGDVVVIRDHLDWLCERQSGLSERPTRQTGSTDLPRREHVYCPNLAEIAHRAARRGGFCAVDGTYLATLGPTYETRAEYRMMRRLGADVVGMSTVPEVLAAAKLGMSVLAVSIVSNVADPDRAIVADHAEVLHAGNAAAAKIEQIVRSTLR
ncbi:purine-nucleoside phosphorylase [Stieleria sp. TO1_6]|uniref:purine-nucleoside phosphorylase n=1 Tax=Stieleria tagensis TaxID=2956795 RepID=UPI00209BA6D2|nr:purine-nucleoside phosphorylase [Stieleria tagensis]MCO8121572.1 purine-nucleoside phosphorylase [Stieleria tagensis]